MTLLESLVLSGRIVDIALAVLVVESLALYAWRRRARGGISPWALLANLGAGGSLMLALRAALTGAGWTWIATWLVAALVFHLADLAQRLNRAPAAEAHG